jgi:hypothetical protein
VRPSPSPSSHDPNFDPPRHARPGSNGHPTPLLPQQYQRLVANPFLAVLALVSWGAAMGEGLARRKLWLVMLLAPLPIAFARLLQYHCLDCGATGRLFRWKDHACERVVARQLSGKVRRFRGPNPAFQTILWGYLVIVAAILVGVVFYAAR